VVQAGGGGAIERALLEVAPGRFDAYEALLGALGEGQVWMLLWFGEAGRPDAQYGNMEVGGFGYAPCVTSAEQLAASGWSRAHQLGSGREVAAALYRERWGLWLNPHQPGGGVGVPWADLRRVAGGLDRLPAGPLQIGEPTVRADAFYAALAQAAQGTPVVRSPGQGPSGLGRAVPGDRARPLRLRAGRGGVGPADDGALAGLRAGRGGGVDGGDVRSVRPGGALAPGARGPVLRPYGPVLTLLPLASLSL